MNRPARARYGSEPRPAQPRAGPTTPNGAYQLGLRRVLDGLSVLIDQKKSTPAER
jgi:hypothetical protein